jgi:hypothetical protein
VDRGFQYEQNLAGRKIAVIIFSTRSIALKDLLPHVPACLDPTHDVLLTWATFTEAADESGMSRRYGGVHVEDGDLEGRALDRRVAALSWNKARSYVLGMETAGPAPVHVTKERAAN